MVQVPKPLGEIGITQMTAEEKPQKRATHVVHYNRTSAADQLRKSLERIEREKKSPTKPKGDVKST